MDGASFLTYVKRILRRTDKDTEVYEATTDTIADIRIQLKTDDYKEEAYVAGISVLGDYRISLPSDFGHLIGSVTLVDDSSGYTRTLNKITKQTYDDRYSDRLHSDLSDVNDAMPVDLCIYGGQIFLGPVPDLTTYKYYINYTTEAFTEVTALTTDVPFSGKYRSTLRAGVLAEVFSGMEQFDEAEYWRGKFNEGLSKLKANEDDNVSDRSGVIYHGI